MCDMQFALAWEPLEALTLSSWDHTACAVLPVVVGLERGGLQLICASHMKNKKKTSQVKSPERLHIWAW